MGGYKHLRSFFEKDRSLRLLFFFRKAQQYRGTSIFRFNLYRYLLNRERNRLKIELPLTVQIGPGCRFLHPYNITFNGKVTAGKNLTMLKGSTIGNTHGSKGGTPRLGDNVYVGLNATVVGDIQIGNDVLICANSFVNFNVPDHSIVLGNPGVIHSKDSATKDYISNPV